jgi:hypothetical protein
MIKKAVGKIIRRKNGGPMMVALPEADFFIRNTKAMTESTTYGDDTYTPCLDEDNTVDGGIECLACGQIIKEGK